MYGIGAYFAIRDAVQAFRRTNLAFDAPFTPEKVLLSLYGDNDNKRD
jgi:xanthine dehydrogenase large subunit